ncbi:hypothetical protein JHK87_031741 [Glycine soja]|nr:hypothetical protein JHK87_031741 [Glycine soja]
MHSEAEALEHMKKRDTGHQSVSLENKTGDSTMLKIGDSAKVVIKQDMKGRKHKYGFNNNKREKPDKVRVVDDETGNKHELVFFERGQCGFYGVRARTMWVFQQCKGVLWVRARTMWVSREQFLADFRWKEKEKSNFRQEDDKEKREGKALAINDATVKFETWDTTGQERYHSLAPMYYRGVAAAIIVYDITSSLSGASLDRYKIPMVGHFSIAAIATIVTAFHMP